MLNRVINRFTAILDEEEILILYRHYLNNIKKSEYPMLWVKVRNLKIHEKNVVIDWDFEDPFLQAKGLEKIRLAEDIIRYGTYHPFYVFDLGEANKGIYVVKEGKHRLFSLQILSDLIPEVLDMKFLCMKMNNSCYSKEEVEVIKFKKPVYCKFPTDIRIFSIVKDRMQLLLDRAIDKGISNNDGFVGDFLVETSWEYIKLNQLMSDILRDAIFIHKELTGRVIRGADELNIFSVWKRWMNK